MIVPGDCIIPTLIHPLDKSKIPNLKNPDPKFALHTVAGPWPSC